MSMVGKSQSIYCHWEKCAWLMILVREPNTHSHSNGQKEKNNRNRNNKLSTIQMHHSKNMKYLCRRWSKSTYIMNERGWTIGVTHIQIWKNSWINAQQPKLARAFWCAIMPILYLSLSLFCSVANKRDWRPYKQIDRDEKSENVKRKTKGRTDKHILKTSLLILVAEPRQIHE